MVFSSKVHVSCDTAHKIKSIRKSTSLSNIVVTVLATLIIISLIVISIVVPIVLVKRANKKPSISSPTTTADITSTSSFSTLTTTKISTIITVSPTASSTASKSTSTAIFSTTTVSSTTSLIKKNNESVTTDTIDISESFSSILETTAMMLSELNDTIVTDTTMSISTEDIDNTNTGIKSSTTTTTMVPPNLLINPGAESGSIAGWTQLGPAMAIVDSGGNFNKGYYPRSGTYCFAGGYGANGDDSALLQNVQLLGGIQGFTVKQLDSGDLRIKFDFYYQTWDHLLMRHDEVEVIIRFRSSVQAVIQTVSSGARACKTNPGWCSYQNYVPLPIGTRSIDYMMKFTRRDTGGSNIDSYVDDNSLIVTY